jgi:glutathione S-transferase
MITLYQFAPAWGLPNASSFCLKLETYLRMAEIPFRSVFSNDITKTPKGKFPYIEEGGRVIADSNLIIEYLKATYGDRLDGHLTRTEAAIALAMQRLMEENLYWSIVYSRWQDPTNWEQTKAAFFSNLPLILQPLITRIARNATSQNLKGHGMGRHTATEVYEIGIRDLNAVSDFLADKPFFMGDQPTGLDASAYGILANILWVPVESPLKTWAEQLGNLVPYCQYMKARFYGE